MQLSKSRSEDIKGTARKAMAEVRRDIHFLSAWAKSPLRTGAIKPSSRQLARVMADEIPEGSGPVIELGPGTGNVTEAILAKGVLEEDLVLVEYNPEFAALLKSMFPKATVVSGDAYNPGSSLEAALKAPARALVSGLPLLTKPPKMRQDLLQRYFALMAPGAPFIQFTYCWVSPVPVLPSFAARGSQLVPGNLPPARVWTYRANQS